MLTKTRRLFLRARSLSGRTVCKVRRRVTMLAKNHIRFEMTFPFRADGVQGEKEGLQC